MLMIMVLMSVACAIARPLLETKPDTASRGQSSAVMDDWPGQVYSFSSKWLGKRQQELHRTIKATYDFNCPVAGARSRSFSWTAKFVTDTRRLSIRNVLNVNHISSINTEHSPSFWAAWEGYLCVPLRTDYHCAYLWTGRTEGSISDTGIILTLVIDSTERDERPRVKEWCYDPETIDPRTCPILSGLANIVNCVISGIDVQVIT